MSNFTEHFYYLYKLTRHLDLIGEDRSTIESIIQEPIWFGVENLHERQLCDLIILYRDGSARPIELKGSSKKRKANRQIRMGFDYILQVLEISKFRMGKSVIYQREDESYSFGLVEPPTSLKKYLID